jgi:hypothetical protein
LALKAGLPGATGFTPMPSKGREHPASAVKAAAAHNTNTLDLCFITLFLHEKK